MPDIKGYIGQSEYEGQAYYYYTDGQDVYRAPASSVVDTQTGYLIGRWECSFVHFNHYRQSVFAFVA